MRAWLAVTFVAACAVAPAAKYHAPQQSVQPRLPHVPLRPAYLPFVDEPKLVRRPRIDVATVAAETDRRRLWPLSELPSLQPHHDFAMARDRCSGEWAQRNKKRPDLVAYGAAWCKIEAGDHAAISVLAKLATQTDDIGRAARLDVINLVAGNDAARAIAKLHELRVDDTSDLDLLAATYDALDMHEEALAVAKRVWRVDAKISAVERCERLLAWSELDEDSVDRLSDVPNELAGPCTKRAIATMCAIDAASAPRLSSPLAAVRECFNEFPDDADAERRAWLLVGFFRWSAARSPTEWLSLSRDAENALGLAGAEDLAITALDNAVLASPCNASLLREVAAAAYRIANLDQHWAQYEPRLDALRSMSEKRCNELHD